MTKPYILVCDGMDKDIFTDLKSDSNFEVFPEPKNSQDVIAEEKKKASALIIRSATTVTKEFLADCPNLKYVIRAGEGTDNIDKAYCAEVGVKVSNTPGANNNSAAEHAVALTMTLLRKTAWANESMQSGAWDKNAFTGNELWKKKVGVVGFGRIGQLFARRISGFEPDITYYDPFIKEHDIPYAAIKRTENLEELFESSDVISIHVPLNDHTKNLVNKTLLSKMKKGSVLINAARGGIVNELDLVSVLKEGNISAALDVFGTEPLKDKTDLHGLPNLILTPHLGGSTEEAQLRVGEMAVHQIREFFNNNNLLNEVKA